jgi:hypothetical protein
MRVLTGRAAALVVALACAAALPGCQAQRNEYNPVRIFCPGDFDAVGNRCVIDTGKLAPPEEER